MFTKATVVFLSPVFSSSGKSVIFLCSVGRVLGRNMHLYGSLVHSYTEVSLGCGLSSLLT